MWVAGASPRSTSRWRNSLPRRMARPSTSAVALAVLAGIAAGDAICIAATGERYSGPDHAAAADLLARVDTILGRKLRDLVDLKPGSHYGQTLLSVDSRTKALRAAKALVDAAVERTA